MTGTDATATGATEQTTETQTDQTTDAEKAEVDWKAKSREWEKRAKANADAATKLAEIEESQKTETQKLTDAKAAAEKAADEARADALRWRIAAKHQISDEQAALYLTGTDEATLTKQAEGLANLTASTSKSKTGNYVPKEGTNAGAGSPTDERTFVRELFGSGG